MLPACNMVKVPWEEVGIYREEMGVDLEEVEVGWEEIEGNCKLVTGKNAPEPVRTQKGPCG